MSGIVRMLVIFLGLAYFVSGNFNGRIVGGEEATPHEFPFIVNLRLFDSHACGGAIINTDWIITAAHCAMYEEEQYVIVAGDHNNAIDEESEQHRSVLRIVRHPLYNPLTLSSDFAMMQMDRPFEFDEFVTTVQFPPRNFLATGNSTTAGWGRLAEGGASPDILNKVVLPLVDNPRCFQMYSDTPYAIDETMICAGGDEGEGGCHGDSGGPMMCDSENGIVHCGVVSFANGCARDGYPEVYARTSYFLDFVDQVLGGKF